MRTVALRQLKWRYAAVENDETRKGLKLGNLSLQVVFRFDGPDSQQDESRSAKNRRAPLATERNLFGKTI